MPASDGDRAALADRLTSAVREAGVLALAKFKTDMRRWTKGKDSPVTEVDMAVDDFIELVAAVDGILQAQVQADASYFAATCGRAVGEAETRAIEAAFLQAYRWQYIHSGAQHPHFGKVLSSLITEDQGQRIQAALSTLE